MFKHLFCILTLFLLVSLVFAQTNDTNTTSTCKSEDVINQDIAKCKANGGTYDISYDSYQCKIVNCKYPVTTPVPIVCPADEQKQQLIEKCKLNNMSYTLYKDNYGCEQVNCVQEKPVCPDISADITKCKEIGGSYGISADEKGCSVVKCIEKPTCPDETALNNSIDNCTKQGMSYSTYIDNYNCKQISCVGVTCPDVEKDIIMCKEKGLDYEIVYPITAVTTNTSDVIAPINSNCKKVVCKERPICPDVSKDIAACKEKGLNFETVPVTLASGNTNIFCKKIKCTECPSTGVLETTIKKCVENGQSYETFANNNGCKDVKCIEKTNCPTKQDLDKMIKGCLSKDMDFETTYDNQKCQTINCRDKQKECPEIKKDIQICEDQGLIYKLIPGYNGCKSVICELKTQIPFCRDPIKPVQCKKYIENNCTIIACEDGFSYNSCNCSLSCTSNTIAIPVETTQTTVPVDCKKYIDEKGCYVKVCSDGSSDTTCPEVKSTETGNAGGETPETSVTCKTYSDEQNCNVKECTDGYIAKACPMPTYSTNPIDSNIVATSETIEDTNESPGFFGKIRNFFIRLFS